MKLGAHITDSRGRGLNEFLDSQQIGSNKSTIVLHVRVYPGADLNRLKTKVDTFSAAKTYDLIVIIGGICDLTSKVTDENDLNLLEYTDSNSKKEHVLRTLSQLRQEYAQINIATIPPFSLKKYLTTKNPLYQLENPLLKIIDQLLNSKSSF